MKISSIKVKLKDEDIFQAIQEYVKVDNFKVNSLTFNDTINISCTFKKKISIPIKLKVRIYEVEKNVLFLSIADLNLAKIHIFSGIISFGLKKALKDFKDQGIYIDKDIISIDMNVVGNKIPSAKFELVNLCTEKGYLEAEVKDLQITKPKEKEEKKTKVKVNVEKQEEEKEIFKEVVPESELIKSEQSEKKKNQLVTKEQLITKEQVSTNHVKVEDQYTILRNKAIKKVPEKYMLFADYALIIPDIIILFGRLLKDKRVSIKSKAIISSVIAYFVVPLDVGIFFVPFIGEAGAVAIAFFALSYIMEEIPEEIILDNWQGEGNVALMVKNGVELMKKAAGGRNIQKLLIYPQIKEIKAKKAKKAHKAN